MKRIIAVTAFLLLVRPAFAEPIVWQIPGMSGQTLTLPFTGETTAIAGGDIVLHEFITGIATQVLIFGPSAFQLTGNIGACTQAFTGSPAVQPYVDVGHNLGQYAAGLSDIKELSIRGFGRYDTTIGKVGAGFSVGYIF